MSHHNDIRPDDINAAHDGDVSALTRMLDNGMSPEGSDPSYGATPLIVAATNDHMEVAVLLLNRKADPNASASGTGWTPLHGAAHRGDEAMVDLLVSRGAKANVMTHGSKTSTTPAITAQINGFPKLAKKLRLIERQQAVVTVDDHAQAPHHQEARLTHIEEASPAAGLVV